jgi:signal transduction histidine kinase
MLDDLLELAQLKKMPGSSNLQSVAVADALEKVFRQFQPAAEAKGLDFRVHIHSRPTMLAQPGHLRSLWTHLIDNAIRYTPSGRVEVMLVEHDDRITSSVTDSGIGISIEEYPRIFQEFYRSETARAEVELGTGLGLPIVNQIAKLYQGNVEMDSTPGRGSTFTVNLPTVSSQ